MSKLRDTIVEILTIEYYGDGVRHLPDCAFIRTDQGVCNCKEEILARVNKLLQAVRDVVPEQRGYDLPNEEPDAEEYGYNQCRADILKELGGGE